MCHILTYTGATADLHSGQIVWSVSHVAIASVWKMWPQLVTVALSFVIGSREMGQMALVASAWARTGAIK
jgi:hypothetical protein